MNKISTFLLWCFVLISVTTQAALRVVVLGSSTSEGAGATAGNSWVSKYRVYLKGLNSENEVINLAKGGYTSYHIMANGNIGKQTVDVDRNITKALSLAPDVIIINMPTNDAAYDYTVDETMDNFAAVIALATAENVPVFISTSQGRNFPWPADPSVSVTKRNLLIALTNRINSTYGANALDFWNTITNADGTINSAYDSGDGIHLNDAGHAILYDIAVAKAAIITHARSDYSPQNINIDFGSLIDNNPTTQWNAFTDFSTDGRINNLKTADRTKSGIYAYIHDNFEGVNLNGAIQNSLGYPQMVSEDSFYGQDSNPTGGITLGGLSAGKKYRFKFYAGRIFNGDNTSRETKYVVTGQTSSEVLLEATNNDGNVATIADVFANANGVITITASAGANNATGSKFFYMGAIEIQATQYQVINSPGANGTILVDFGSPTLTSTGNWNNFTDPRDLTTKVNLVKTTGETTGYSMFIHDDFNAVNTDGTGNNTTYAENATKDSFYGNEVSFGGYTSPTAGVTMENLDLGKKYSFKFFASRMSVSDNRETKITVTGNTTQIVNINTANNVSNYATVNNMVPDINGKIVIDVTYGNNNTNGTKFYYLGMVEVNYETTTLPVKLLSFTGKRTLSGNQIEWKTANEINNKGFDLLRIENNTIKSIGTIDAKNASQNIYTYTDRQPLLGDNYYQLKQIDNDGTAELSEIIVVKGEKLAFSASFSAEKLSIFASAQKGEGKLILSDLNGRILLKQNVTLEEGSNHYIFTTQALPSGVYILSLVEKAGPRNIKILKL